MRFLVVSCEKWPVKTAGKCKVTKTKSEENKHYFGYNL